MAVIDDLVLLPHCDLHMVLPSAPVAPELRLKVFRRTGPPSGSNACKMEDVTSQCTFEFFAPNNVPGQRFLHVPIADRTTGLVTATTAGVYLFQVSFEGAVDDYYIVGRLQVHKEFVGWWFGIDSITTARDPEFAHALPSIYAKFKDDAAAGTDVIGDITGHRYVRLTSSDTSKVVVDEEDGRLRGVTETETSMNVTGSFVGLGPPQTLPVRVVDYGKDRNALVPVRVSGLPNAFDLHNILFLPEGFTVSEADRDLFDKIVEKTTNDMFEKGRHQPFGLLEKSFNVFKAYLPSQEHAATCGFRVTDQESDLPLGTPIPYDFHVEPEGDPHIYTMAELVTRVGLPMRSESRVFPKTWDDQKLPDFTSTKVNQTLIDAWKAQQSEGILHARDTVFGLHLGRRLADRESTSGPSEHPPDVGDVPGHVDLQPFLARLYEFYTPDRRPHTLTPDTRRHSPRLQARAVANPGNSIMRFISGLRHSGSPNPIGAVWTPGATFKPSRGLVAVITYDAMIGGTNFNNQTLTAVTLADNRAVAFAYAADKREMRRTPPEFDPSFGFVTDTVAHEFGHSFNLDDEYELSPGEGEGANAGDPVKDNVATLGFLRLNPALRTLDTTKVKWFELQRMKVSSRLLVDAEVVPGGFKVFVGLGSIGKWVDVKKKAKAESRPAEVSIRNQKLDHTARQLPLKHTEDQFLQRLDIGEINENAGSLVLTGPEMPVNPPQFRKGSALYLPLRDENGELLFAVEKNVLEQLNNDDPKGLQHLPLNLDQNRDDPNRYDDVPKPITGFEPPCKPKTLIGIFEGAARFAGAHYRPAGACKMRNQSGEKEGGEYCFVCKWLIVNRVDPSFHAILSEKFYPKATKKK